MPKPCSDFALEAAQWETTPATWYITLRDAEGEYLERTQNRPLEISTETLFDYDLFCRACVGYYCRRFEFTAAEQAADPWQQRLVWRRYVYAKIDALPEPE